MLFPLFILISVLLAISIKGSPFFTQIRPGKNEKLFKIMKFKTMKDEKDVKGELLPDEDRMTRIGSFLRKSSLDELPQLLNVIKGDLSFIGPRPLLVEYLPLYSLKHKKRHNVKPGISGWAQVNGRNSISWEEKFELDIYYADNISFILDLKIFLMTFWRVIRSQGVNADGAVTISKFTGSK